MPKRRGEIAGFWLSQHPNSGAWCRTWFDPRTRQTCRRSLGTSDLQQAGLRLAAWIAEHAEPPRDQKPADEPLGTILLRYWHGHAKRLRSAPQAMIELNYWSDHFGPAVVSDLTPARQEAFVTSLRDLGHSDGYISRILSTGRAALRRAHKRGELQSVPFVADVETAADKRAKQPKGRVVTIEEIARLFDAAEQPHVRMYLMIACCTLARPEAILDLTIWQRDRMLGTLDLNPAGRRQTRKHRPIVPVAASLAPWLDQAAGPHYVAWRGKRLGSIKTAWRKLRADAGLDPAVTPYSIRHSMARELRRRRVPLDQIGQLMGHVRRGVTALYAPDEPEQLTDAVTVIDQIMVDVDRAATRSFVLVRASLRASAALKVVGAVGIEPTTPTMST